MKTRPRTALLRAWPLLMLLAVSAPTSAQTRDPDATTFCPPDDDAAVEALAADPRWWCAVRRARCLLGTPRGSDDVFESTPYTSYPNEKNVSEISSYTSYPEEEHNTEEDINSDCQIETCDVLPEESLVNSSVLVNSTEDMEPKLFCRSSSKLVWYWGEIEPEASSVFVVSVRDNETWLLHDVVSEPKFNFIELNTAEQIQLRVQFLNEDGTFATSCNSRWIPALNGEFEPSPVSNASVAEINQFSVDSINMSIQWEPDRDNPACDYAILYWNVHGENLREIHRQMVFTYVLPRLDFSSTYRAYIMSEDRQRDKTSEILTLDFVTPSCLDVWNKNLSICSPPPPGNVNINFSSPEVGHYEMNMSWIPATILPEGYIAYMNELSSNRSELKYLDGNSTSVIFKNTKPFTLYRGCIYATSTGGNSSKKCDYRKFKPSTSTKTEESHYTIIAVVITLSVLFLLSGMSIIIAYHFHRSRSMKHKEKLQICLYNKNMVKEPPEENENYETTTLYCADEWEISEDRLRMDDILGEGAFGVVRRGRLQGQSLKTPSQNVAVKMLRDDANSEDLHQFRKEIDVMKSVGTHPHIVSLIGCCTCSKQPKLIVEYCDLGALHLYLRKIAETFRGPKQVISKETVKYAVLMTAESSDGMKDGSHLNVAVNKMYFEKCKSNGPEKCLVQADDLLSFARQIAKGMEFLSNSRIVHRDLAARNVLVCSNKTVKISDFGLSRDIYEQNVYHKKSNSRLPIKWMAIESLRDQVYTTQSDVWSFGILLWEIVTLGAMPYPYTPPERVYNLLSEGYRLECPSACSQDLYDVMLTCWRAKPKERPSFRELYNRLDHLLEVSSPQQYLNLNVVDINSHEASPPAINHQSSDNNLHNNENASFHHTGTSSLHPEKSEGSEYPKDP